MNKSHFYTLLLFTILSCFTAQAQELPRCRERAYLADYPRVISNLWCIEIPLESTGEWDFTSIAISPAGRFYATRPNTGQLLALVDSNADRMPDAVEVLAEGLRLPNGLALDSETLYIVGDGVVYRYENDELSTVADDLPGGRGFMARGIAVQDGRIYVGIPYPCDSCAVDNELYGTVLSMDAQGGNRQIVARGLRYPAGMSFYNGALWVTDTARDALPNIAPLDEVNRIDLGSAIPHFGFPYCVGLDNQPDIAGEFDCTQAVPPVFTFYAHSNLLALDTYESDVFPWLRNRLLVVLGGSFDNSYIHGYTLIAVRPLDNGLLEHDIIMPRDIATSNFHALTSDNGYISIAAAELVNQRGGGVWPHRLLDVAVSPEGWIYSSVGGRGIFVLRPGDFTIEEICRRLRECN